jgi:dTDP-4-dehydrorhamnose reductase
MSQSKKILVLGATGMLGHKLVQKLSGRFEVTGTVRGDPVKYRNVPALAAATLLPRVLVEDLASFVRAMDAACPDVVINCIGLIKQYKDAKNPLLSIRLNAMLPHYLSEICGDRGVRLIHFSTDCVFSGNKGGYMEEDFPDASDIYGRTKLLGEVGGSNQLTIRTSIIGHELSSAVSLIDWFLTQTDPVKGYASAVYSGFPTVEMARILMDYVIPNDSLEGLYHVASSPISKYELLTLVAKQYRKIIEIIPDDEVKIDRSLDSTKFSRITGYVAPGWGELIARMHHDYLASYQ